MASSDAAAQELLRDAFTRLIEHVDDLTDGLSDELSDYRPTPNANSIAWLIWHSARVQDIQLAHVAGVEEVAHPIVRAVLRKLGIAGGILILVTLGNNS